MKARSGGCGAAEMIMLDIEPLAKLFEGMTMQDFYKYISEDYRGDQHHPIANYLFKAQKNDNKRRMLYFRAQPGKPSPLQGAGDIKGKPGLDAFEAVFTKLQKLLLELNVASPGTEVMTPAVLYSLMGARRQITHTDDTPQATTDKLSAGVPLALSVIWSIMPGTKLYVSDLGEEALIIPPGRMIAMGPSCWHGGAEASEGDNARIFMNVAPPAFEQPIEIFIGPGDDTQVIMC